MAAGLTVKQREETNRASSNNKILRWVCKSIKIYFRERARSRNIFKSYVM